MVDVYCDMTNGGQTYEDFGIGQYSATYSGWERLRSRFSKSSSRQLSYFYNLQS